ncbi:hypothetical protein TNCT_403261 [Trichonephila clavata]|uniref:Uncharacterized protein n=1 Tax=Trichonephila clavata TaxID=2740835 RepID=A0A8X6LRS7_TRICU|nr:hypothetical protein TNCT_403261 [Trichonephila clavata]
MSDRGLKTALSEACVARQILKYSWTVLNHCFVVDGCIFIEGILLSMRKVLCCMTLKTALLNNEWDRGRMAPKLPVISNLALDPEWPALVWTFRMRLWAVPCFVRDPLRLEMS